MVTTLAAPTTGSADAQGATYREAAAKTRDWLDAHFDGEGRCVVDADDPRSYYKAPYLLALAGLRAKGHASPSTWWITL